MKRIRQWLCWHRHRRRERDAKGVLVLRCERCDHVVPAIQRTPKEAKRVREFYQRAAQKQDRADVRPFKKRGA
jgi:hypothetical protein